MKLAAIPIIFNRRILKSAHFKQYLSDVFEYQFSQELHKGPVYPSSHELFNPPLLEHLLNNSKKIFTNKLLHLYRKKLFLSSL